jgi:hypothetical protein
MNAAVGTCSTVLQGHRTNAYDSADLSPKNRILEPHDHGVLNGSVQLLGYQVAGSSSRRLPNWVLMKANEITALTLLEQTFPGGRPTSSGNLIQWDKLFIRVKPVAARLQATSQ